MPSFHLWNTTDKLAHFQVGTLFNTYDLVVEEKNAISKLKLSFLDSNVI